MFSKIHKSGIDVGSVRGWAPVKWEDIVGLCERKGGGCKSKRTRCEVHGQVQIKTLLFQGTGISVD